MTCTADSEYIRAVSVKYRRCPSSYSTLSAVARAGFQVKPRPKTAVEVVPPSVRPRTAQGLREKTQMLEELMFFYGRNVHQSFSFAPQTSPERAPSSMNATRSSSLRSTWNCQNEALRQMFKASERCPRYRFFPSLPKPKATSS